MNTSISPQLIHILGGSQHNVIMCHRSAPSLPLSRPLITSVAQFLNRIHIHKPLHCRWVVLYCEVMKRMGMLSECLRWHAKCVQYTTNPAESSRQLTDWALTIRYIGHQVEHRMATAFIISYSQYLLVECEWFRLFNCYCLFSPVWNTKLAVCRVMFTTKLCSIIIIIIARPAQASMCQN